ncbi:MAG TPA: MFS transporter [Candidatus Limnocylindria bacterium]
MSVVAAEERASDAPATKTAIPREAFLLAASLFAIVAATNIVTPLLPVIRDDFAVSIATAGVIVGSYGLARLLVDLPAGFLLDRLGHLRLTVVSLVLLFVASLVGFQAATVEMLIASRVGAGIAVAILATVILAGLGATATVANRGKVMSLFHVANNTGIAVYPMIGGFVGAAFGWRATFAVTAGLVIVAAILMVPSLMRIAPKRRGGGGGTGSADRVLHGRERVVAIGVTNFGVVANMINRHGFRNTILPLYAATVLGLGGVSIATAIALMAITGLMVATPGGMLGDRIGRGRIIVAGLAALAVGDLVFLLTHDLLTFLAASALIGFGDFFASSQTALLSEIVPPEQRTRSLASYRFSADLGAFIGPVVLAAIMDMSNAQAAIVTAVVVLLSASAAARLGVPALVRSGR